MQFVETTRFRMLATGLLTSAALLFLFVSFVALRAQALSATPTPTGEVATRSAATNPSPVPIPTASAPFATAPTGTPTVPPPTSTTQPFPTPSPQPTAAATTTPAVAGATPTGNLLGAPPAFSSSQLANDYALARQALAPREPAPGLYGVAVVLDRATGTVNTQFLLLSTDGKLLYTYQVGGQPRVATARPGSPEAVTPEMAVRPYSAPPWASDPAWPDYAARALTTLVQGGWSDAASIGKVTVIARSGLPYAWELVYDAAPRRFHFTVTRGVLTFTQVEDPAAQPLPPAATQPWGRYAGQERFARNFRLAPNGLPESAVSPSYTSTGYQLACASNCAPFAAVAIPTGVMTTGVVETEVAKQSGSDDASFGIIFRAGAPDYLLFGVDGNGAYLIAQGGAGGQPMPLARGVATVFQRGTGTNTLVAVVVAGAAHFFINGQEVWQGQVSPTSSGNVGLFTSVPGVQLAVHYLRVFDAAGP